MNERRYQRKHFALRLVVVSVTRCKQKSATIAADYISSDNSVQGTRETAKNDLPFVSVLLSALDSTCLLSISAAY